MGAFAVLAEAFSYPSGQWVQALSQRALELAPGPVREGISAFGDEVQKLSLGEGEELYTHTWDLDPIVVPYVGYQLWGDDYRRGSFMARLRAAYRQAGISSESELPDHLVLVLRYLDRVPEPIKELVEALPAAIAKMKATLDEKEPGNPYRLVLGAFHKIELPGQSLETRVG